jgi:hypothetical protein
MRHRFPGTLVLYPQQELWSLRTKLWRPILPHIWWSQALGNDNLHQTTFRSQNGIKTSVSKVNFLKDHLGMPDWNLEYEKYHALEVWEPLRVMCTECEMTRNASEISGHYILYPQLELPSKCPACLF